MTDAIEARVDDVVGRARALIKHIGALPEWIGEAAEESAEALYAGSRELRDALDALAEARHLPPSSLADVLRWIGDAPTNRTPTWWGRVGAGPAGYVCDGHALLLVDDAPGIPNQDGVGPSAAPEGWTPEQAERAIGTLLRAYAARAGSVILTPERLEHVFESKPHCLAVGATYFDAQLAARWAVTAARLAGGDVAITFGQEYDPVGFEGAGWRGLLMPLRHVSDEDKASIHRIEVSP